MAVDAVLIELLSEVLNATTAKRRCSASLLLESLKAGLPPEKIADRIAGAEREGSPEVAADARRLAQRLGVLGSETDPSPGSTGG